MVNIQPLIDNTDYYALCEVTSLAFNPLHPVRITDQDVITFPDESSIIPSDLPFTESSVDLFSKWMQHTYFYNEDGLHHFNGLTIFPSRFWGFICESLFWKGTSGFRAWVTKEKSWLAPLSRQTKLWLFPFLHPYDYEWSLLVVNNPIINTIQEEPISEEPTHTMAFILHFTSKDCNWRPECNNPFLSSICQSFFEIIAECLCDPDEKFHCLVQASSINAYQMSVHTINGPVTENKVTSGEAVCGAILQIHQHFLQNTLTNFDSYLHDFTTTANQTECITEVSFGKRLVLQSNFWWRCSKKSRNGSIRVRCSTKLKSIYMIGLTLRRTCLTMTEQCLDPVS